MNDHEKKLARERQQRKRAKQKEEMSSQKEKLLSVPDEKLTLQQAVNADDISGRTRNWLFIVYPESAPENWRSILDSFHVPWIESPLHDADVNADSTEKKAHWHIMLLFDSVKSYQQILPFSRAVNGSFPIKCRSLRGSVRYFYHADNPEKAQYSKTDIKSHCGAELEKLLELSSSEKSVILNQIFDFIVENNVVEFADILDYARLWRSDWYDLIVSSYTLVLRTYLQSRRNSETRVRFFLDLDGNLQDTQSLSYDDRISNLKKEIQRIEDEKVENLRRIADAQKKAADISSNANSPEN